MQICQAFVRGCPGLLQLPAQLQRRRGGGQTQNLSQVRSQDETHVLWKHSVLDLN